MPVHVPTPSSARPAEAAPASPGCAGCAPDEVTGAAGARVNTPPPPTPPPPPPAPAQPLTTGQIATLLGGRLVGRADLPVQRVDALEDSAPGVLTFIREARYARGWASARASAALVKDGVPVDGHDPDARALIFVPDPDVALIRVLEALQPRRPGGSPGPAGGIHPTAVVDPSARVDPRATVGPHCFIGADCRIGPGTVLGPGCVIEDASSIGAGCVLHAHVSVRAGSEIGDAVILHAGVRVGADGFGYRPDPSGRGLLKIPHAGNVRIGRGVEIGANTCIDRARFGSTTIGEGTKIDNLVQIAHNCRIGRCVVICGCTGIAGSVTIGDGAVIGGNCGIADNVTIGAGARVAAKSGVMADVAPGQTVAGLPAMPGRDYLRLMATLRRLGRPGARAEE
jgi:UDP-3-O-[3-hydroxymyristoyl] glucosamine N-acyltransferase